MRVWLVALVLFVATASTYAWLIQRNVNNPQVVTRLGLTLSIVEHGRLDIDWVAGRTVDKARFGEHVFTDKPPGLSLLAVPVAALAEWVLAPDVSTPRGWKLHVRLATALVVGLMSAIAVVAVYLLAHGLGATPTGALVGAAALGLATPYMGWSTAFFAHAPAGCLLLLSLWAAHRQADLHAGIAAGFVIVVDLTAVPAAAAIAIFAVTRGGAKSLLRVAAGAIVGFAPLPIYNWLAFGSPLTLGYSGVRGFEGMQAGVFGLRLPDPVIAGELLFGLYRGLLPLSPILIGVPIGLAVMFRAEATRATAWAVVAVLAAYLAINASYFYWHGGWSTGPRHLVAMLPFACLALAFAWPKDRAAQWIVLALLILSAAVSLVCASADMFSPQRYAHPLFEYLLPKFVDPATLVRAAPVLVAWVAVAVLIAGSMRTERHQLAAGPLQPALQVELQQQRLHGGNTDPGARDEVVR